MGKFFHASDGDVNRNRPKIAAIYGPSVTPGRRVI